MSDENRPADEGGPLEFENVGETPELVGDEGILGSPWDRRTFLKAAALGTAAAALWQKGPGFTLGPAAAWANDLSTNPCTAGDVEIIGTGVILNEPCSCTPNGTFNANVEFTVRNNTSTGRYCIVLHLVASDGVSAQDVILHDSSGGSTAPGKSGGASYQDTKMTGTITGVPCSAGLICFGQAGVVRGKCDAGTCTTIAWSTTPGDAGCTDPDQKPPGGQCRHQQICIQGFGASLVCKSGCTPACGGQAVLTASVTGGTPGYSYHLTGTDGTDQTYPASGLTNATSHDFTVTVTTSTTYTLTVTDKLGCQRTATTSLTANAITATLSVSGVGTCNDGLLVFSATSSGSGCSFSYKIDGVAAANTESDDLIVRVDKPVAGQLTYRNLDGACHTISVDASCSGGCAGSDSLNVKQCVATTTGCTK